MTTAMTMPASRKLIVLLYALAILETAAEPFELTMASDETVWELQHKLAMKLAKEKIEVDYHFVDPHILRPPSDDDLEKSVASHREELIAAARAAGRKDLRGQITQVLVVLALVAPVFLGICFHGRRTYLMMKCAAFVLVLLATFRTYSLWTQYHEFGGTLLIQGLILRGAVLCCVATSFLLLPHRKSSLQDAPARA